MRFRLSRTGPTWIGFPMLAGAVAALSLPGASGTTAAGAALLAVGALALLAGHTWGLMVSIPSHVTLVGRVWPSLAQQAHGAHVPTLGIGATAVVLVTALPALALTVVVLPEIARVLLHDRPRRTRALFVACASLALAASLILPAFAL